MATAIKYDIGDMFRSSRFDDEVFYIKDTVVTDKPTATKKGKPLKPKASAYLIGYIPEVVTRKMPNGSDWVHNRKEFISNDDLIDKELSMGTWIKMV